MLDPHSCLKHARSRCNVHVATATHSTPSLLAAWHKTSELPRRRQSWYVGRQRALQTPDSKGPASIRSCVSQGTKQDLRKRPIAFWRGSHQTSVQLPGLVETMANRKKMKIENLHRSILFRLFHFHDCCSDGSDTLSNTLFKSLWVETATENCIGSITTYWFRCHPGLTCFKMGSRFKTHQPYVYITHIQYTYIQESSDLSNWTSQISAFSECQNLTMTFCEQTMAHQETVQRFRPPIAHPWQVKVLRYAVPLCAKAP